MNPAEADHQFFRALIAADTRALDDLLADDFVLIDVMSGAEIGKNAFLGALGAEQVKFNSIEPSENRTRLYGNMAIVTGRTEMAGQFLNSPFTLRSRYTHVYVAPEGKWHLATAQGTQIKTPSI